MRSNENYMIKCIFYIFIIVAVFLFITNNSKSLLEGFPATGSGPTEIHKANPCNDCRITPKVGNPYIAQSSQSSTNTDKIGYIFSDCTQLNISGSDISYVFCPWTPGTDVQLISTCPSNNTVAGTNNRSYCCNNIFYNKAGNINELTNFYSSNYLKDTDPTSDVSLQYGIIFKYTLETSKNVTNPNAPGFQVDQSNFSSDIYQNIYNFTPISSNHTSSSSLFNNRFSYNTSINATSANELSGNTTKFENSYITCNGDISTLTQDSIGYIPPACFNYYNKTGYKNYTIGQGVAFCVNYPQYCNISNVASDCSNSLMLPKYGGPGGVSNEWYRVNANTGLSASPDNGFVISGDSEVQTSMQNAVTQLMNTFTQQINSLTDSIGDKLQFPNIGPTQYLDVGACDNNSPYVYNGGCDGSMGYLQNYTCIPSLTGAFSDCGPPAYEPKPQLY